MKVVLKASILDAIYKRIEAAKRDRREILHIIVTEEEYAQLRHECYRGELDMGFSFYNKPDFNMTVKTIDLDDPDRRDYGRTRFLTREKLLGYDLYVVPERFAR